MPEADGTLNEGEKKWAQRWIDAKWNRTRECPISGHRDWLLADRLVQLQTATPGIGLDLAAPVYPNVALICKGCGYTLLFNAVLMRMVSEREGQQPSV